VRGGAGGDLAVDIEGEGPGRGRAIDVEGSGAVK
jgi:hypothetical protein